MTRPPWEVADIIRSAGKSFIERNRSHLAWQHLKVLHAKIGQLALENDFLEGALIKAGMLSAKR